MKEPAPSPDWPESWKYSYGYDKEEVFGPITRWQYFNTYKTRKNISLEMLWKSVPRRGSIIDIAAGQGNFSIALDEMDYSVTWNDLREELVDYVRLKAPESNIRFLPGNAFEISKGMQYDAALIAEIIEHVAHPDEFLKQVAALVKPGGVVVMTTPNGAHWKNRLPKFSDCLDPSRFEEVQFKPDGDGHIFLIHPGELKRLADFSGLKILKVTLFNNPLTCGFFNHIIPISRIPQWIISMGERVSRLLPQPCSGKFHSHMAVLFGKPG